jgi:hypothetical protein
VHAARTAGGEKISNLKSLSGGFPEESADRLGRVARGVHAARNAFELTFDILCKIDRKKISNLRFQISPRCAPRARAAQSSGCA